MLNAHKAERAEHHPHHRVAEVRLQELIRAAAGDHGDAVLAAQLHRFGRDAGHAFSRARLGAHHAMHPDVLDAEFHALLNDLIGDFGIGENEDGVGPVRDRLEVGIAGFAFKRSQARIDGGDGITGRLKPMVTCIATRLTLTTAIFF